VLYAESVKKPQEPLSLRISGHLLLGLARIYARKVGYLLNESTDAFSKLKSVRPNPLPKLDPKSAACMWVMQSCSTVYISGAIFPCRLQVSKQGKLELDDNVAGGNIDMPAHQQHVPDIDME
jgi:hypothetical protein